MKEETYMTEETRLADPPPYPDTGVGSDHGSTYSTPRWVKVFGIILIVVLVLLFLIQHLVFEGMAGHML
jgi:hypothetical protein